MRASPSRRCVPIDGRYLVSVFPITAGEKKGHVVLLHDLSFVDDEGPRSPPLSQLWR